MIFILPRKLQIIVLIPKMMQGLFVAGVKVPATFMVLKAVFH